MLNCKSCKTDSEETAFSIVHSSYIERPKASQQKENVEYNSSPTVEYLVFGGHHNNETLTPLSDDSRLLKTAAGKIYFPLLSHRQQFLSKTEPILVISIKRHESLCCVHKHVPYDGSCLSTLAWQISKYLIIHMQQIGPVLDLWVSIFRGYWRFIVTW